MKTFKIVFIPLGLVFNKLFGEHAMTNWTVWHPQIGGIVGDEQAHVQMPPSVTSDR